jgi:hypothetical protein
MKNFTVYDPLTGEVIRSGCCLENDFEHQAHEGEGIIEGQHNINAVYIDFVGPNKDLLPVSKGEQPSNNYVWDPQARAWVGDIQAARTRIKLEIEKLRTQKDNAIIIYDNKNIDADQASKDAVMKKLAELQARDAASQPESAYVWRDADNVTHTFLTLIGYKLWLNRLLVALSARTTALRVAAWAHKDAITALNTVPAIESYDYTAGW